MQLKELQALILQSRIIGNPDADVTDIQMDSRKAGPGTLFVCVPGLVTDGHRYAAQAVAQGAAALVVERDVEADVPKLVVPNARFALAVIADHFFGYPSREMKVIGITGTNGKTTTSCLIEHVLREQGFRTGLLGTIRAKIGDTYVEAERTTQESVDLQRTFREMRKADAEFCVMEVSSHALDMGRVNGVRFRTALFTNLTQDHLDYHRTMENYRAAKGLLFARLGNTYSAKPDERQYAVLNADDPASVEFRRLTSAHIITYGLGEGADVRADDIRITAKGNEFRVHTFAGSMDIRMNLVGRFNVYNALGAIASTLAEGVPLERIANSLERVALVDGRMELVQAGQEFAVIVDYAHTPDGLENALSTVREFARGRVITVFGCGGDRDRTKRPIMGRIAGTYSDIVVCTSDNPRTEEPQAILEDIRPGIEESGISADRVAYLADRRAAIQKAVEMAAPDDVVLIAGKGHETYQIIGKTTHDFDDREVAKEAIRGRLP